MKRLEVTTANYFNKRWTGSSEKKLLNTFKSPFKNSALYTLATWFDKVKSTCWPYMVSNYLSNCYPIDIKMLKNDVKRDYIEKGNMLKWKMLNDSIQINSNESF